MYSLAKPRRVRSSRRGSGVEEYRVRVKPRPPVDVRQLYNESRPVQLAIPKLVGDEFVLICAPDLLQERLVHIEVHGLAHLRVVTDLIGGD